MGYTPEEGWTAIVNISGRTPMGEPPKDKLLLVRNFQNRGKGLERITTERLAWWSEEDGKFITLTDDLFREPRFIFFHTWRVFEGVTEV